MGEFTFYISNPASISSPDVDENLRIVLHKIIGNSTFVNNLMILIEQYNDFIYTHSYIGI